MKMGREDILNDLITKKMALKALLSLFLIQIRVLYISHCFRTKPVSLPRNPIQSNSNALNAYVARCAR